MVTLERSKRAKFKAYIYQRAIKAKVWDERDTRALRALQALATSKPDPEGEREAQQSASKCVQASLRWLHSKKIITVEGD